MKSISIFKISYFLNPISHLALRCFVYITRKKDIYMKMIVEIIIPFELILLCKMRCIKIYSAQKWMKIKNPFPPCYYIRDFYKFYSFRFSFIVKKINETESLISSASRNHLVSSILMNVSLTILSARSFWYNLFFCIFSVYVGKCHELIW